MHSNWAKNLMCDLVEEEPTKEVSKAFDIMLCRAHSLKEAHPEYKDLFINPEEDILNSKPQIIQQVYKELWEFLEVLKGFDTKSILQIGLGHFGCTHFIMSLLFEKVISIEYDLDHIVRYKDTGVFHSTKESIICGDSQNELTIDKAKLLGPYGCLFIDGNHSYDVVAADHKHYAPLVKTGGIVAFHDALLEGPLYGVPKVLKEIKQDITIIKYSKEVGIAYYIKE
jgi:predicted O-methyltransferase YrrM